jgi:hypothetical protein
VDQGGGREGMAARLWAGRGAKERPRASGPRGGARAARPPSTQPAGDPPAGPAAPPGTHRGVERLHGLHEALGLGAQLVEHQALDLLALLAVGPDVLQLLAGGIHAHGAAAGGHGLRAGAAAAGLWASGRVCGAAAGRGRLGRPPAPPGRPAGATYGRWRAGRERGVICRGCGALLARPLRAQTSVGTAHAECARARRQGSPSRARGPRRPPWAGPPQALAHPHGAAARADIGLEGLLGAESHWSSVRAGGRRWGVWAPPRDAGGLQLRATARWGARGAARACSGTAPRGQRDRRSRERSAGGRPTPQGAARDAPGGEEDGERRRPGRGGADGGGAARAARAPPEAAARAARAAGRRGCRRRRSRCPRCAAGLGLRPYCAAGPLPRQDNVPGSSRLDLVVWTGSGLDGAKGKAQGLAFQRLAFQRRSLRAPLGWGVHGWDHRQRVSQRWGQGGGYAARDSGKRKSN